MSELPPLPSEDINDGEIRVFTYRHLREYGAIARQQGRDEMREWKASRVRDEALEEAAKMCERRADSVNGGGLARQCARDIRSLIGTPKSAEGEGVVAGAEPTMVAIAKRNLRAYLSKASFASNVDREAALNCVEVLEQALAAVKEN